MTNAIADRRVDTSNRPLSDAESAICYRMEPTKRMLCRFQCAPGTPTPHSTNGNHVPPCLLSDQSHTVIDLEKVRRVALMVTPQSSGAIVDQAWESISTIRAILKQQPAPMTVTSQTIFMQRAEDIEPCRQLFRAYFGARMPATNFVLQPPCGGQLLAIEAWAIDGDGAVVQFPRPNMVSVAYDGLHWIHLGIESPVSAATAYSQVEQVFSAVARRLDVADASFKNVVRTWLYEGGITATEGATERYRELNRARSDFFKQQEAQGRMMFRPDGSVIYPASTGVGMSGRGFKVSCLALRTSREDVWLQPLENPQQTSAFQYASTYSAKSPKFSRAMAVVIGDYVTTWISGTASIVNSETVHLEDVEKQTEQTIDNIERLISSENFERHGISGAGARLGDLAKVRVYVKRPGDYEKCRAICERRFGPLPTIYAQADLCRPNLLVEIEGVAFSRVHDAATISRRKSRWLPN